MDDVIWRQIHKSLEDVFYNGIKFAYILSIIKMSFLYQVAQVALLAILIDSVAVVNSSEILVAINYIRMF